MKTYIVVIFTILFPFIGISQNSFELEIDMPGTYEYPLDIKQLSNGNYISVVKRQRPDFDWKELSHLFLINEYGEIIAHDSIVSNDTIFNTLWVTPYNSGILAIGHYGFFNDTTWLKPIGQFIAYFDLEDNLFDLQWINKYDIRNSGGNLFYWSSWPVIKQGTDSCFIACLNEGFNVVENIIFVVNASTGDSLSKINLPMPSRYKSCDLFFTDDNKLNVSFELYGQNRHGIGIFKMNNQCNAFIDTLYSHPFLTSDDSKAEVLPNGNIILAGQCDSVMFDPFDVQRAFGVFLYDPDFNYLSHHILTNFDSDTASQSAWLETVKVNSSGEVFVLSNYYFQAFPFEGKATKGYIAKLDSDLHLIWEEYFGGDKFHSLMVIEPTDDGGVIFCSHSNELSDTTSKTYSWFRKYDLNGFVGIDNDISYSPLLSIYPNPSNDYLFIEASDMIRYVKLFDMKGIQISKQHPNSQFASFDVQSLVPGVYILQLLVNNVITNKKIIIK